MTAFLVRDVDWRVDGLANGTYVIVFYGRRDDVVTQIIMDPDEFLRFTFDVERHLLGSHIADK